MVLNGSYSDYSGIESSVPQGSDLGPFLFLIYINDLERNIKSNIKFFTDDTMLFSVVKNPEISANDLNHDLDTICQWAHQWRLEFNPDPTKQAMVLSIVMPPALRTHYFFFQEWRHGKENKPQPRHS